MEVRSAPSLLPILRSRQQGEVLTYLMCDPDRETSMSELAHRVGVPLSSVHREVERAEAAGIITSRRLGNTRFVRADTDSPYYDSLSDLLVRAFGPPHVLAEALEGVEGIEAAYVYGSWAARLHGVAGRRPVNDIDVLVLGEPEQSRALPSAQRRRGTSGPPGQRRHSRRRLASRRLWQFPCDRHRTPSGGNRNQETVR